MFDPKLKEALGRVQKPGRYTGGEPGSIYKEKDKVVNIKQKERKKQ